uniref:uncharacterized protein LOC129121092 isoform X3 n=1 Tax=Agelaius phoeniceus TaxID=39638 RepID=UPI0023ED4E84|nr:uncharacterized protein LOC129121092 isoform X3 [Agelaius phoeniceus]
MARRMASARSAGQDPSDGTVPGVWRNWRRAQETFFILRYKRAGKDSRIPVVRLSAAREDTETVKIIRSKCDCRENKLERTKGRALMHLQKPWQERVSCWSRGDSTIPVQHRTVPLLCHQLCLH